MSYKGISSTIATVLMIVVTLSLASTAYYYTYETVRLSTAVEITMSNPECPPSGIVTSVRNDGTSTVTGVLVSRDQSVDSCTIPSIEPGTKERRGGRKERGGGG